MPYIKAEARAHYYTNSGLGDLIRAVEADGVTPGDLNYIFTCLAIAYTGKKLDYQRINDVMGALEGAKLEFYRRRAAPYETKKIIENGDVYND